MVDLGTTINFDIVGPTGDFLGGVICPGIGMSISGLFYIIGGQYLVSKLWNLVPISGYAGGARTVPYKLQMEKDPRRVIELAHGRLERDQARGVYGVGT